MLVTRLAILLERLVDDVFEFHWNVGIKAHWRHDGSVHDRFENYGDGFAAERGCAGGHLVKNRAEAEEIAARIQFSRADLLGRHVRYCADGAARAGEVLGGNAAAVLRQGNRHGRGLT